MSESREIKEPTDVDSLGKLRKWLSTCGMPQFKERAAHYEIEHEEWGFGFHFERGNRDAANLGYRELVKYLAQGLYCRFHDPRYKEVFWRLEPELDELAVVTKLVNADGTDFKVPDEHREAYEDGEWQIPADVREIDTGLSMGKIYCRLGFVLAL